MREIAIFAVLALLSVLTTHGQEPEWAKMYSEKFHFIAEFPEQPTESSGEIETRYGKAPSTRWRFEAEGKLYEISVSEFSDVSVKDSKSLDRFYKDICTDLFGKCIDGHRDTQFDVVGEERFARLQQETVSVLMYMARNRFYMARVVVSNKLEKDNETRKAVRKFIDGFLFLHLKEGEKKWTWGLPPSATQVLQGE